MTRGRLPARIYWVRRTLVLAVALVLVFAIARVLGSFGGDDGNAGAATVAQTDTAAPDHVPGLTLVPKGGAAASAPLSQPTGTCDDADVQVTPDVDTVAGGGGHPLTMLVSSTSGETCSWRVSSSSLAVKITSDGKRVWSSQDCPGVITSRTVVVRPPDERQTKVKVDWGGHRSVPRCLGGQDYAGLGTYRVEAASVGGEPSQVEFSIVAPPRPRVTETASPTATPSGKATGKASAKPGSGATTKSAGTRARAKPSAKSSGHTRG